MPAGSNPVIHLKKGTYKVTSTITVPSQVTLSIVGDGASENGSGLRWTGSGKGPVIWLKGPSRATLRDFGINSNPGADGLLIDKADQEGGRVYGYQVQASGAWAGGGHLVDAAFEIDGVERSYVNIIGSGFSNFLTGVRVIGGPLRSTGQPAPGRISFLTGASSAGNRLFDIESGGILVGTAYWYEGDWNYLAPLLDLPSTSSGSLVLATMFWATQDPFPIVRTSNFKGSLAILGTALNTNASTTMSFTGSGSQTDILTASSMAIASAVVDFEPRLNLHSRWQIATRQSGSACVAISSHLPPPIMTERTAVLAATTHILCCSCGMYFCRNRIRDSKSSRRGRYFFH